MNNHYLTMTYLYRPENHLRHRRGILSVTSRYSTLSEQGNKPLDACGRGWLKWLLRYRAFAKK